MKYMGSKRKYWKDIVPIIQRYINEHNIEVFIDAFVGAANLSEHIIAPIKIGNDLSFSLIGLHKQAQTDFSKIPTEGSREMWDRCYSEWKRINALPQEERKESEIPFYEIGAIEWYGSFSGRGFPGGYAKPSETRNPYVSSRNTHEKEAKTSLYQDIIFTCGDYRTILERFKELSDKKILFYFDSPYKGTKAYGISPHFNFEEYYDYLRKISQTYPCFISEQEMPEDFPIVWEKAAERTVGLDNHYQATEKLFFLEPTIN